MDGAVSLDVTRENLEDLLNAAISDDYKDIYSSQKNEILQAVLHSRYKNLYSLLRDNVSEETYLGIVRNKILCDVQGEDM
jgi:hypothetical protein